jgi:hypothetical protein
MWYRMVVILLPGDVKLSAHLSMRLSRIVPIDRDFSVIASESIPNEDVDLWIVPGTSSELPDYLPKNVNSVLIIHDLYLPGGDHVWGSPWLESEITSIITGVENSIEKIADTSHWLHVRDLGDVIAELVRVEKNGIPERMDVCGRREWTDDEVREEVAVLWQRFSALQSGDGVALVESMVESQKQSTSKFELVHVVNRESGSSGESSNSTNSTGLKSGRPDLEPLHRTMMQVNGTGFHPSIPLRTGLMEMLAGILEGADGLPPV